MAQPLDPFRDKVDPVLYRRMPRAILRPRQYAIEPYQSAVNILFDRIDSVGYCLSYNKERHRFGGQGLSGTGPKAGGPHYLPRFATEQTITLNTAATGGNLDLIRLVD